ncbi:MAG: sigma-70 family RNA polymerase sigma factor [Lewinellaceae bacterium]|nr:sigma-70 family RNA polymerase sigma factor [Lewinellaceae bacterium]
MQYADDYLIAEIQAGGGRQEKAIKRLYEQYFHLARTSRKKYRTLEEDDLVTAYNSAVIALRRQLLTGVFRGESSLATYLTRIFSNKCIDLLRQKSGSRVESIELVPEKAGDDDILQHLVQSDQIKNAMHHLQLLGEVCKQILLDSEYWGYSSEEIAERIGFSNANSVNSKKYSCLQKLRQMMTNSSS